MRPIEASTKLKKCKWCDKDIQKAYTESWPHYQKRAKFCSTRCGAKNQFRNGMPEETKMKMSESLKGNVPWNSGTATIKECIHCGKEYKAPGKRKHFGLYCTLKCRSEHSYQNKDANKQKYRLEVWRITNKQPLHILENFDKRGKSRKGTDNYQVDHIIPIIRGYETGISPEVIGDIKNLRMIHWKQNIKRGYRNETN